MTDVDGAEPTSSKDGSERPTFLPPDQDLGDSETSRSQVEQQPPAGSGPPLWQRPMWAGGAGVLLIGAIFGGFLLSAENSPSEPPIFRSSPDPCAAVPAASVNRLVQHVQDPPKRTTSPSERGVQTARCEWNEPVAGAGGGRITSRSLTIGIDLHAAHQGESATAQARYAYKANWDTARAFHGRSNETPMDVSFREAFPLRGIGDEAFARPVQTEGPTGNTGKVIVTTRLRNAIITVSYQGSTYPLQTGGLPDYAKAVPMTTATARAGAEEAARAAVNALATCATCTG